MAGLSIREATDFWIEAGALSGGARNQIEFSNELAEFFDNRAREEEVIKIRLPDGQTYIRPLTYRGTDYGQWTDIWRLGLPTAAMGGPDYSGQIIKFERITEGDELIYEIVVADADSAEVSQWKSRSRQRGTTAGPQGRLYGFW